MKIQQTLQAYIPHLAALALFVSANLLPAPPYSLRPVPEPRWHTPDQPEWLPAKQWEDPQHALELYKRYKQDHGLDFSVTQNDAIQEALRNENNRKQRGGRGPKHTGKKDDADGEPAADDPGSSDDGFEQFLRNELTAAYRDGIFIRPVVFRNGRLQAGTFTHFWEDRWPASTRIVFATMPGSSDAITIERRVRNRYALTSALTHAGFRPKASSHIGVLAWSSISSKNFNRRIERYLQDLDDLGHNNAELDLPIKLTPYEWFVRNAPPDNGGGVQNILVIWVNDDYVDQEPISLMNKLDNAIVEGAKYKLDNAIVESVKQRPLSSISRVRVYVKGLRHYAPVILGPTSSAFLEDYYQDVKNVNSLPEKTRSGDIRIFSPYATATIDTSEDGSQTGLSRTISQDQKLVNRLLNEFDSRGFSKEDEKKPALLVVESDSFYGQRLASSMKSGLETNNAWEVEQVNYFSGIDGRSPLSSKLAVSKQTLDGSTGDESAPQRKERNQSDTARLLDAQGAERSYPVGGSQTDYIQRSIKGHSDWLLPAENGHAGDYQLIGILGSDIYDKLTVLQLLRPVYPQAQFFTTDLDAAMFHPEEYPHTRNMLVAAGFGLQLRDDLQGNVPPFRDTYQTSWYYASLCALNHLGVGNADIAPDEAAEDPESALAPPAMLFEIGQSSSVILDPAPEEAVVHYFPQKPEKSLFKQVMIDLSKSVAFLLGLYLLYWLTRAFRLWLHTQFQHYLPGMVLAGLVLAGLLLWLVIWVDSKSLYILILMGVVFLLLMRFNNRFRLQIVQHKSQEEGSETRKVICGFFIKMALVIGGLLLVFGVMPGFYNWCAVYLYGRGHLLEPNSWTQGVSSWPAIQIRLVAVVLGVVFLRRLHMEWSGMWVGLLRDYKLTSPDTGPQPPPAGHGGRSTERAAADETGHETQEPPRKRNLAVRLWCFFCNLVDLIFSWIGRQLLRMMLWHKSRHDKQVEDYELMGGRPWCEAGMHDAESYLGKPIQAKYPYNGVQVFFNILIGRREAVDNVLDGQAKKRLDQSAQLDEKEWRKKGPLDVCRLAERCSWVMRNRNRAVRLFSVVAVMCLGTITLEQLFGVAPEPIRDPLLKTFATALRWVSWFMLGLLAFSVLDMLRAMQWFVTHLAERKTHWPKKIVEQTCEKHNVGPDYAAELLDIRFIAELTQIAGKAIYYPGIVLLVLIASRSDVFDNWHWTPAAFIIMAAYFFILSFCAVTTKSASTTAKALSLQRVEDLGRHWSRKVTKGDAFGGDEDESEYVTEQINSIHNGAYGWLLHGPIAGMILVLVGGYSLIQLIESFAIK